MKVFINTGKFVLYAFLAAAAILLVITLFSPFGFSSRVVLSGSMEPAIKTGSVVVVGPQKEYNIGDVVTYQTGDRAIMPTTHRIIGAELVGGATVFTTRGDANSSNDATQIGPSDIQGKVVLSIPYLGYILEFARTPLGLVVILVIPSVLVMRDEILAFSKKKRARTQAKDGMVASDKF